VIATQPEQVPTLSYYLPRVTNFLTPLGHTPDPRVVDWRGALGRLKHASVAGTLAPALASLRPGRRVMLVVSLNLAHKPLWMKLVNHDSSAWAAYMSHDPRLQRVATDSPHSTVSGLAVRATVYVAR
jgi:hypothetical protein